MFASGELRKLIASGLRGMTSNPSIFEKAIDGGSAYDVHIESLIGKVSDPGAIFEALAIADIRAALGEHVDEEPELLGSPVRRDASRTAHREHRSAQDAHRTARSWKGLCKNDRERSSRNAGGLRRARAGRNQS